MTYLVSPALVLGEPVSANAPAIGYDNKIPTATLSATTMDASYPLSNLANSSTFLVWKGASALTEDLVIDLPGTSLIDYVGIARHNLGSGGRTIKVDTSMDLVPTWVEQIPATALSVIDTPLMLRVPKNNYRKIRIRMGAGTIPQIAVVYCGALMRLPRNIYVGHTPINLGRKNRTVVGRSSSGNFLGRVTIGETAESKLTLANLDPAWYRSVFDPFVRAAVHQPFFFAWRPNDYPAEVGYVWSSSDPMPSNQRANGMMQVEMPIEGIVG